MPAVQAIRWGAPGASFRIIDQRELPMRRVERELRSIDEVCDAIRTLAVRGAPAIGIAGAMGLTLAVDDREADRETARKRIADAANRLRATRPTAVNLGWALDRMLAAAADQSEE